MHEADIIFYLQSLVRCIDLGYINIRVYFLSKDRNIKKDTILFDEAGKWQDFMALEKQRRGITQITEFWWLRLSQFTIHGAFDNTIHPTLCLSSQTTRRDEIEIAYTGWLSMCIRAGSRNARVFPVPVWAIPIQSIPCSNIGHICNCIGDGFSNFCLYISSNIRAVIITSTRLTYMLYLHSWENNNIVIQQAIAYPRKR